MLASLVDLYMSNNDLRLNKIMGRLTVVSVIFIPLTFLVGVWGMNFKVMPELDWKYGYAFAWGMMIVVAVIVAIWLKKKNWF
jgi:magnesium transporter